MSQRQQEDLGSSHLLSVYPSATFNSPPIDVRHLETLLHLQSGRTLLGPSEATPSIARLHFGKLPFMLLAPGLVTSGCTVARILIFTDFQQVRMNAAQGRERLLESAGSVGLK